MKSVSIKASRYSKLFWNKWSHDKNDISYNVGTAYDIHGNLDDKKFLNALHKTVESNVVFKSYFNENDKGELYQCFPEEVVGSIILKDISGCRDKENELNKIFYEAYNYKFNLTKPPLIRFYLVCYSETRHILIMRFHHILIDGTGIMHLPHQIENFYNDDSLKPDNTAELFVNYIKHEDEALTKCNREKAYSYWNEVLGTDELSISLSGKKVVSRITSSDSIGLYCFELSSQLAKQISSYCSQNLISPSHFFMGVWSIQISRYTGKNIIPLTYPVNMRPKQFNKLVTCLVNMLPLIVKIDEKSNFLNLVKSIAKQVRTAFRYKNIPFTDIITEYYRKTKSTVDNNMFNIGINGTESRTVPMKLKGLPDTPLIQSQALADYDINLEYQLLDEAVKLQFNYNKKLFDEKFIVDLGMNFSNLVDEILKTQDKRIEEYNLLDQEEYNRIIKEFNNTEAAYPFEKTMQEVFEEQAERTPNNLALVFDNKYLTYKELNQKANQLAHTIRKEYYKLIGEKITSDTLIGIYIDRGINMIIAILAILKSGAAYVPFDLNDPEDRLKFKINDSGARLVLTALDNVHDLVFLMREDAFPMSIDTYWNKIDEAPKTNPEIINKSTDLAYVIYTSGSTGKPKGVMQLHRTVTNLVYYQRNKCKIDFVCNILQFTSVTFDVSVQEIFSTLFSGGTLYLITESIRKNILSLIDFIISQRINILFCPPAILNMIFNTKELTDKFYASSLKHIIAAGDKLVVNDNLRRILKDREVLLHNHYGPTESHVTTAYIIKPEDADKWLYPPIGRAVSNHKLYVLDKKMRPQPVGIPGELYIAGDGLARGYYNRDELTKERFIANPFSIGKKDPILYKTGDMVKWMQDGNLEYIERNDFQVKIRGFRIEMGEIESKLHGNPYIKECVVTVYENKIIDAKQLVCYYMTNTEQPLSGDDLKKYLSDILPYYMIPTYFLQMEEFPVTINGKVNRRKLPPPNLKVNKLEKLNTGHSDYNNIRGELAEIWKRVLGADNVGYKDNFFEIGGNSILSIQLMDEINTEYEINAPNYFIYNYQTIEKQAVELGKSLFSPHSPFIFFNESKSPDILILIHPTGAGAEVYHKLVQQFDAEKFRIIGINSYNINNQNCPTSDLKFIAKQYFDLLKSDVDKLNTSSLYVGGWSSGGNIAYELSGLMLEEGMNVQKLILFDSFNLFSLKDKANFDFRWQQRFVEKQLFNAGLSGSLIDKMKNIIKLETVGLDELQHNSIKLKTILFKCMKSRPYNELIDMSEQEKKESDQINNLVINLKKNGWKSLITDLNVINLPSHHGDIVTNPESICKIADVINKLI